ncbi:MAG: YbaB/EbfC family nucleoid-associated protein [Gammaproteobacteria bacterium WSBS_2016_MAG_OTU1]
MTDDTGFNANTNKIGLLFKSISLVQQQMESTRDELTSMEVIGESGGGLVRVVLIGGRNVRKVEIDDSLLADGDMLQDLIAGALNDALQKTDSAINEKMQSTLISALERK